MALKTLFSDLTAGVNAYPNHNTPSTAGGFNYGKSYTPVFEGVFRQTSFKFGEGSATDRPFGDYSKEPYLYSGLLAADQLPDVPNPSDSGLINQVGDFVDSATDGLIRGGLLTQIKRSAQDALRIGKWAFDGPEGPAWLITQTGLQRTNPKTEEEPISLFGVNLGGRSRIYNPLGINTLAQTLVNFTGLHLNRAGGPTAYGIKQGYGVDSTETSKYEYQVRNNADNLGNVENMNFAGSANRMISLYDARILANDDSGGGQGVLYDYSGGPHSVYGIGRTTLKRYEFTRGESSKLNQLNILKNATSTYNASIETSGEYTPYYVKPEDGGTKYKPGNNPEGEDIDGRRLIYRNSDFNVNQAYQVKSKNITDFRKNLGRGYSDYQLRTGQNGDGVRYIREERVNTGNPGVKLDKAVDSLGRLDYTVYNPEAIDKINALDIIRTEGDFTSQKYRDFIRFRIEAIDSDDPTKADSMIFRAFLEGFQDNYNASHNNFKYNGRGEEFYTYNSFKRAISFSFKIAAQSRHEMMPLYRKLNFLVSNVAPEYKVTRMRTPFIRLTIGSMMDRIPGVLNSVSLKWNKNYPFEIALDGPEKTKRDMLVLPHVLDVSVQFTPVHNFLPQKSITDSPFILSHKNNRTLQVGEQWYSQGAAENLDEASLEGLRTRMGLDPLVDVNTIVPDETERTKTIEDIQKGNEGGSGDPAGAQADSGGGADGGTTGDNSQSQDTQDNKKDAQNPTPKSAATGDDETKNTGKSSSDDEIDPNNPGGVEAGTGAWFFEFFDKTTKTNITLRGYYATEDYYESGKGFSTKMNTVYSIMVNDVWEAGPKSIGQYDHSKYGLEGANNSSKDAAVRQLTSLLKQNKKGDFDSAPEETKIREATYAEIQAEYNG